jgi:hypothetical protein
MRRLFLALGALVAALPLAAAERTPILTTPHFAFHSDFETNLNDALLAAGTARRFGKAELFRAGEEVACFEKLSPSAKAGWEGAVEYYEKIVVPAQFNQSPQYPIRLQLAGLLDAKTGEGTEEMLGIAAGFRAAAAPAYRACRWSAQDVENRHWVAALEPRLTKYEAKIAARLEQLYHKPFGGLPIQVDVVKTVSWSGANSVLLSPAGGHLLVSTDYHDESALEVVFHESSHVLMVRADPVWKALDDAARAASVEPFRDLWHVVLFYTTGETVRRVLADGGVASYEPMLYGIFARGAWVEYREPVERAWRPYLDEKRSLSEAASDLIEAVKNRPVAR